MDDIGDILRAEKEQLEKNITDLIISLHKRTGLMVTELKLPEFNVHYKSLPNYESLHKNKPNLVLFEGVKIKLNLSESILK